MVLELSNKTLNKYEKSTLMKKFSKHKILLFSLILFIFLIGVDQYIKKIVSKNINLEENFSLIPNIVNLTFVKNYGAAFSIFLKQTKFLIVFTIVIILIFLFFIIENLKEKNVEKNCGNILAATLIVAGGVGNLIDRCLNGYVIDYVKFVFWPLNNFAIFNFADCLVVFGCIIILINYVKTEVLIKNKN